MYYSEVNPTSLAQRRCQHRREYDIETVTRNRRTIKPKKIRNPVLVTIQRQSTCQIKMKLKGALWNARSLSGKIASVSSTLIQENLDFLIITETWLKSTDDPLIANFQASISGYNVYQKSRSKRRGGGVAILARTNLLVKEKTPHTYKSFECLDVTFRCRSELLRLVVVYRPPRSDKNKSTTRDFISEFASLLELKIVEPGHLLICGDFNLYLDKPSSTDAATFTSLLQSMGLKQHVQGPTHQKGHTLDLLITRADSNLIDCIHTSNTLNSDHSLLQYNLNIVRPPMEKTTKSARNLKAVDIIKIKNEIASSFLDLPVESNVNVMYKLYETTMTQILNELAPIRKKVNVNKPRAAWFNNDLMEMRKGVRKCERRWKKSGLVVDKEIFLHKRIEYCRRADEIKATFHRSRIQSADTKTLFTIIDELTCSKQSAGSILPTNVEISELPELFNDFFADKITKLVSSLVVSKTLSNDYRVPNHTLSSFTIVTDEFIINLIKHSLSKSCALDTFPTQHLKDCIVELSPVITRLFNLSLQSGVVPEAFKQAIVKPRIKKPNLDQNILKNYRPVSNLTFLSKTLERVVAGQLNSYLTEHDLFAKCQSAYRSKHSTETALLRVQNDIMLALDDKKDVILVMLDLSAAFDTLDHDILLHRLQFRFGINGSALKWFTSYLTDRTQCVAIGPVNSSSTQVKFGVPQGSVLGPVLFTLYTAPLEDLILKHELEYMMFADDSQLYAVCNRPTDITPGLENCVTEIREWMTSNGLVLNDDKTEVIQFRSVYRRDSEDLVSLKVGSARITPSSCVRNLGVFLSSDGKMTTNVNSLCKSAFYALYRIGKIRPLLDEKLTEKLIHAFVTSRLDYCNSLLYGIPKYELERLQSVQNSAARLIKRNRRSDHITPVLKSLHWLPIEQRIKYKVCLFTFKIINNECPAYLKVLAEQYIPSRALRSEEGSLLKRFDNIKTNKTYGWRAFKVFAPYLWNMLPASTRHTLNINSFKQQLKTFYFREFYG